MQNGFARLIIIIVIGLVLLFGFRVVSEHFLGINTIKFGDPQKQDDSSNNQMAQEFQGNSQEGHCKSGDTLKFEAEFTDLEKIEALAPIGTITGGSPGRSYIGVKNGIETEIYSPTDMVLENIIYAKRPGSDQPGEYGLYFRVGCDVTILFDHLDRLSDRLKSIAPEKPSESSRTENSLINLEVKKGEILAYTNGTPQAHTFDFLLIDRSKPTTHINPKRWEWEQAVYSQCPYDYFTEELKKKYYSKLGESSFTGIEPTDNCGSPSHDVSETVSGGWFKGSSTDIKGDYLAIARSGKRVDVAQRKDGDFKDGIGSGESKLRDYSPKIFPEDVKVGGEVCYLDTNQSRWVYAKLVSEEKLFVARGTGSCPASFPESPVETWER
jgi:hypothetical protein